MHPTSFFHLVVLLSRCEECTHSLGIPVSATCRHCSRSCLGNAPPFGPARIWKKVYQAGQGNLPVRIASPRSISDFGFRIADLCGPMRQCRHNERKGCWLIIAALPRAYSKLLEFSRELLDFVNALLRCVDSLVSNSLAYIDSFVCRLLGFLDDLVARIFSAVSGALHVIRGAR